MSASKSRALKIALTNSDVNAKFGEDVEFTADLSTVKEAIIGTVGAVGAVGLRNCLMLGVGAGAATALYVLARSIKNKWPWMKTTNVENDVIEVSVPPGKEKKFADLVEKKTLEQQVAQDFENIETNLEGILGEETYDQYGEEVLKLLKYVRITSIGEPTASELPENMVAGIIVKGTHKVKESGNKMSVFDRGNCEAKGVVAAAYIGKEGVMAGEARNVSALVAKGYDADEAVKLAKGTHGDLIQVRITGEQLDHAFEQGFKTTMTIWDVCKELRAQVQPFKKCTVEISRGEVVLDENLTLAQAAMDGSTRNWKAAFEELKL